MSAIRGTFADAKSIKTRGVYQLLIEIPIENADHALHVLGGIPQPAEERWVGVAPVAAPKKPADETTTEADEPATISNSSLRGGGGMAVGYHHPQPDGAEEQPSEATTERVKDTDDWSDAKRRMVQKSGIVRKEPAFHDFIARFWPVVWTHPRHDGKTDEEKATYFLHTSCGVESCRDLEPDEPSGQKFQDLMWRYGHAEDQQRQREEGRT